MIRFGIPDDTALSTPQADTAVDERQLDLIYFGKSKDNRPTGTIESTIGNETPFQPSPAAPSSASMASTIIFGSSTKPNKHMIYEAPSIKASGKSISSNGGSSLSKTTKATKPRIDSKKTTIHANQIPIVVADGQGGVLTIGSLPEEEKAKITRLVDRLVELGKQLEEAQATLHHERAKHITEMETSINQINAANEELSKLRMTSLAQKENFEAKLKLSLSYLKVYQTKVEELAAAVTQAQKTSNATISAATADVVSKLVRQQKDITQLETLCQSQRVTLETYELTRSRTQQAHDVAMAAAVAEKQELIDEVSVLKSELESFRRTAKVQQQSLDSMSQQLITLQNDVSRKDKDIIDLQSQVTSLQEQLQESSRKYEILERETSIAKPLPLADHSNHMLSQSNELSTIDVNGSWIKLPSNDDNHTIGHGSIRHKKKRSAVTTKRGDVTVAKSVETPPRSSKTKSFVRLSPARQSFESNDSSRSLNKIQLTSTSTQTKPTSAQTTRTSTKKDKYTRSEREYDNSLFQLLDHIEHTGG